MNSSCFKKQRRQVLLQPNWPCAQIYLLRRTDPQNAVRAYALHLVALERAAEARGLITKMLTAKQVEEAQHEASAMLSQPTAELSSDFDWSPTSGQEESDEPCAIRRSRTQGSSGSTNRSVSSFSFLSDIFELRMHQRLNFTP
jgi:hypothetical protein